MLTTKLSVQAISVHYQLSCLIVFEGLLKTTRLSLVCHSVAFKGSQGQKNWLADSKNFEDII